jgi:hypothetical protein
MNHRVVVVGGVIIVAILAAITGVVVVVTNRPSPSPSPSPSRGKEPPPRGTTQAPQFVEWSPAVALTTPPMTSFPSNTSSQPAKIKKTPQLKIKTLQPKAKKQPKAKTPNAPPPKKMSAVPSPTTSSSSTVAAVPATGKCQVSLANFPKGTVSKIPDSKRMRVDNGVAAVTCNPGEYASRGGVLLRFPNVCKGSREVTLTYDVKFGSDSSFDFVKGGKIGWGVQFGQGEIQGGKWASTAASARVMFRAGGAATAYLYYGKSGDPNDLSDQVPEYKDVAQSTGTAGHTLWQVGKSKNPHVAFKSGVWQTVSLYCKMNSPGQHDGVIALTVDGVTRRFDKLRWLNNPAGVDNLEFCTWYGGSGPDWSPKAPETFYFKNAKVAAN